MMPKLIAQSLYLLVGSKCSRHSEDYKEPASVQRLQRRRNPHPSSLHRGHHIEVIVAAKNIPLRHKPLHRPGRKSRPSHRPRLAQQSRQQLDPRNRNRLVISARLSIFRTYRLVMSPHTNPHPANSLRLTKRMNITSTRQQVCAMRPPLLGQRAPLKRRKKRIDLWFCYRKPCHTSSIGDPSLRSASPPTLNQQKVIRHSSTP